MLDLAFGMFCFGFVTGALVTYFIYSVLGRRSDKESQEGTEEDERFWARIA